MLYQLKFFENGRYLCDIGAPSPSFVFLAEQFERVAEVEGVQPDKDIIGVSWLRSGITPCRLLVTDEFNQTIRNINK